MTRGSLSIFVSHPSYHLTDCDPHGDGLAAFEFITRLAHRGHRLHVCVQGTNIRGPLPPSVTFHDIKKQTPADSLRHVEYALRVRNVYRRVARDSKVDVIHQLNPVRPGLSALLSRDDVPLVLGLYVPSWPSQPTKQPSSLLERGAGAIMKAADRIQQRRADALLLSTEAARSRLHSPRSFRARTKIIPYGIDVGRFTEDSKSQTGEVILFLARLHEEKGIFTLLDALPEVLRQEPSSVIHIAGSGPAEREVKKKVASMPYSDRIKLLGHIERDDVPDRIRECDIFCMPSHGEPFGLSALEAMATGKPVVATKAGGLQHLVPDEGGHQVPPRNTEALSEALLDLLGSEEKRERMGAYNRKIAEEVYDWDRVIDRVEDIYYSILD